MNLKNKKVFLTRPYKVVYKDGDRIIKVFTKEHGKANVFNEALCQARVEESGLDIPKVLEVTEIDGEWAVVIEFVEGKTLEELMKEHPELVLIRQKLLILSAQRHRDLKIVAYQYTAAQRYQWFLKNYPGLIDRIHHKYIASLLNMTPVTLSRIRRELKENVMA